MSVQLTFLSHAGFLVSDGQHVVAIDPFLSGNPLATMTVEEIKCDSIVITHGHADHFCDTPDIARNNNATVYAANEIIEYLGEQGISSGEPMNPGGKVEAPFGWVALTHAFHSSSFEGRYMGMPCGAIIHIGGVTIYHLGDTGLFSDLKLIGEIYKPDIALFPIGDRFTMGPDLASRAAEYVNPGLAIPIHYNTWPPIAQDPNDFKPQGIKVKVMEPGETLSFG